MSDYVIKKSKARARRDRQIAVEYRMKECMANGVGSAPMPGFVPNTYRTTRNERRQVNKEAASAGIALVPLPTGNQMSSHSRAVQLRSVGTRPSMRASTTTTTTTTTTSTFSTTTSFPLLPPPPPLGIVPTLLAPPPPPSFPTPRPPAPWRVQVVPPPPSFPTPRPPPPWAMQAGYLPPREYAAPLPPNTMGLPHIAYVISHLVPADTTSSDTIYGIMDPEI